MDEMCPRCHKRLTACSKSDDGTRKAIIKSIKGLRASEAADWIDLGIAEALNIAFDDSDAPRSLTDLRDAFILRLLPYACQLHDIASYRLLYDSRPRLGSMLLAQHLADVKGEWSVASIEPCADCELSTLALAG